MLVLLYRNADGSHGCENNSMAFSPSSIESWCGGHPDKTLLHVFEQSDDLLAKTDSRRAQFVSIAHHYGLLPGHFGARFRDEAGHNMEIIGILPKNRKYTVLLRDMDTRKHIKASPAYVRHNLRDAV